MIVEVPGEATLVESWRALARLSAAAHVQRSEHGVVAIFPNWQPLNNAIVPAGAVAARAPMIAKLYADAGVDTWALWVPSRVKDLDGPDEVRSVSGLRRDVTTQIMT